VLSDFFHGLTIHGRSDEGMKTMAYLTDAVMGPVIDNRQDDDSDYAMQRAFRTTGNFWDVLEMPGQEHQRALFGLVMTGVMSAGHTDTIVDGTS
jgi:hypothetical protein